MVAVFWLPQTLFPCPFEKHAAFWQTEGDILASGVVLRRHRLMGTFLILSQKVFTVKKCPVVLTLDEYQHACHNSFCLDIFIFWRLFKTQMDSISVAGDVAEQGAPSRFLSWKISNLRQNHILRNANYRRWGKYRKMNTWLRYMFDSNIRGFVSHFLNNVSLEFIRYHW